MNKTLKIVEIRRKPWWKFWNYKQWEVTVKINGRIKKFEIFDTSPTTDEVSEAVFLDFVKNKALYNEQYSLRAEEKKINLDEIEKELQKFVGKEIPL